MKLLILLAAGLFAGAVSAQTLLQSRSSWDGGAIAYPQGEAEITAVILNLEPGSVPPFHCHPVPTMGYVLEGVAEIETADGKTQRIAAGEPLVEVMNTVHRGRAIAGPAKIVVFYAGATGIPVTVLPEDDPEGHCH